MSRQITVEQNMNFQIANNIWFWWSIKTNYQNDDSWEATNGVKQNKQSIICLITIYYIRSLSTCGDMAHGLQDGFSGWCETVN